MPTLSAHCRILEAIRILKIEASTRFYQASTSELYSKAVETPQRETTFRSIRVHPMVPPSYTPIGSP